jgi:hypothetical protein
MLLRWAESRIYLGKENSNLTKGTIIRKSQNMNKTYATPQRHIINIYNTLNIRISTYNTNHNAQMDPGENTQLRINP